jgi:hypothetical protein
MWSEPTAANRVAIGATEVAMATVAIGVVDAGVAAANDEMRKPARWESQGRPRNHTPKITSLRASVLRLAITTFARPRRKDAG